MILSLVQRSAELLLYRAPPLAFAMLLTDRYCHLGSFALECVVFLALWYGFHTFYQWCLQPRR
ncbi:MAG: hypothetical protein HUU41_14715 [Bryobacteraceae bacterium]|nr:hypothetical protein [Bryobacteraceae bacterium]